MHKPTPCIPQHNAPVETWAPIGADRLYSVSTLGRVRSEVTGKIMRTGTDSVGYPQVNLRRGLDCIGVVRVHRLVALAFLPRDGERNQVNHINSNRLDNRLCNLEWVTGGENMRHAGKRCAPRAPATGNRNGSRKFPERLKRGADNPSATLTAEVVRRIRIAHRSGLTYAALAARFGTSTSNVHRIVTGATWAHVQ